MEPMKPMAPMEPMDSGPAWWPKKLGSPASSGGQNDMHYAFFPDHHRLAIQKNGHVTLYDSVNHQISGVSQQQGSNQTLTFQSQEGEVRVSELTKVE
ncbi:hypothetical protein [Belnapia rosea]|uniref:hypothetical protein n=1 Tax=Belnapia rosea TaxID=938405 RepID=UPI00088F67CE|nr:hypothetical protein [Belnapia rosea]SDB73793.1 hypothetical protein SAMN02927895_04885 [Belnapia rosea]